MATLKEDEELGLARHQLGHHRNSNLFEPSCTLLIADRANDCSPSTVLPLSSKNGKQEKIKDLIRHNDSAEFKSKNLGPGVKECLMVFGL